MELAFEITSQDIDLMFHTSCVMPCGLIEERMEIYKPFVNAVDSKADLRLFWIESEAYLQALVVYNFHKNRGAEVALLWDLAEDFEGWVVAIVKP